MPNDTQQAGPAAARTLRIKSTTFDSERTAPDGTHRFRGGLVVAVGSGAGRLDEDTARRWLRVGIAEEYAGQPGTTVSDQDRDKTAGELAAEIAGLQARLAQKQASDSAGGQQVGGYIGRSGFPGEQTGAPSPVVHGEGQPIGRSFYDDPDHDPWDGYDLTAAQRTALSRAGFTRPAHVERATDAELLEVDGVGVGTIRTLRAGAPREAGAQQTAGLPADDDEGEGVPTRGGRGRR